MALKTVNWSVKGPDGSAKAGAQIVVKLSQAATLSGTSEVVPSTVILTTDSTGAATAQLQANNDLTPTGTFYTCTEQATDGATFVYTLVVPQTAGPFNAASIMTGVAPTASPGVGHLSSLTVDAGLTVSAGPVSLPAASLSEANVANLTSDLASKANDAAVVHLAGAETITGVKTFSANPVLNAGALPLSAVTGAAADSAVVHNTGAETVAGVKTFSSAPVVPAASFPESAVTNLVSDLGTKANDSAVVHLAGAETITGAKSFQNRLLPSTPALATQTSSIFVGSGVPGDATGSVGDIYFRTDGSPVSSIFSEGFEGTAVQPTLYGSTIVQSNDFETAPSTVDYFHSIGTEALGTLAAWTQLVGSFSIASNIVTVPANGGLAVAGHPDWEDGTYWWRFNFATGSNPCFVVHYTATNNFIQATVDGANVVFNRDLSGAFQAAQGTTACALTGGNWYWMKVVASGTNYTATVYADSAGSVGAQVATTGAVALTDSVLQNGQFGIRSGTAVAFTFGGAFTNVCYVTGPAPSGWGPWLGGLSWASAKEPAFCWSQKQAYYGSGSLSINQAIANSPASGWAGPAATVTAGVTYQTNVWVKGSGTGAPQAYQQGDYGARWNAGAPATSTWAPVPASYTPGVTTPSFTPGATTGAGGGGTVYFDYATIVQPNVPTGILFNSLGAPLGGFTPTGTLGAWTVAAGAPSIASNVVTMASGDRLRGGHADWTDGTWLTRFTFRSGDLPALNIHSNANTDEIVSYATGTQFVMQKTVANVGTNVASGSLALVVGSAYWLQVTASGTTYTAKVYKDAGGYFGDVITTLSATITDASVQSGKVSLLGPGQYGGNYPGTFLMQAPLPPGVTLTATGEPAFCWSKNNPHSGTYAMSVYNAASGAVGATSEAITIPSTDRFRIAGAVKATGAGTASLLLGSFSATPALQNNTWQGAVGAADMTAGASTVQCQMSGVGTAYFDDLNVGQFGSIYRKVGALWTAVD